MKLLLVSVLFASIAYVRLAPTTTRALILPEYEDDSELDKLVTEVDDEAVPSTTTRRSTFIFPTRTRSTPASRPPWPTQRTSSRKTTRQPDGDDQQADNEYDGDFRHFRNFRQYFQKLLDYFGKILKNITGHDLVKLVQQFINRKDTR